MTNVREIKVGDVFGRLTVLNPGPKANDGRTTWECKCACGNTKVVKGKYLKRGETKSCGCLHLEGNNIRHGMYGTPIYYSWANMMRRCYSKSNKSYKDYGGKGIKVASRWHVCKNFVEDMQPTWFTGATIDRIDPTRGYSKDNCRWLTREDNLKHRWNKL